MGDLGGGSDPFSDDEFTRSRQGVNFDEFTPLPDELLDTHYIDGKKWEYKKGDDELRLKRDAHTRDDVIRRHELNQHDAWLRDRSRFETLSIDDLSRLQTMERLDYIDLVLSDSYISPARTRRHEEINNAQSLASPGSIPKRASIDPPRDRQDADELSSIRDNVRRQLDSGEFKAHTDSVMNAIDAQTGRARRLAALQSDLQTAEQNDEHVDHLDDREEELKRHQALVSEDARNFAASRYKISPEALGLLQSQQSVIDYERAEIAGERDAEMKRHQIGIDDNARILQQHSHGPYSDVAADLLRSQQMLLDDERTRIENDRKEEAKTAADTMNTITQTIQQPDTIPRAIIAEMQKAALDARRAATAEKAKANADMAAKQKAQRESDRNRDTRHKKKAKTHKKPSALRQWQSIEHESNEQKLRLWETFTDAQRLSVFEAMSEEDKDALSDAQQKRDDVNAENEAEQKQQMEDDEEDEEDEATTRRKERARRHKDNQIRKKRHEHETKKIEEKKQSDRVSSAYVHDGDPRSSHSHMNIDEAPHPRAPRVPLRSEPNPAQQPEPERRRKQSLRVQARQTIRAGVTGVRNASNAIRRNLPHNPLRARDTVTVSRLSDDVDDGPSVHREELEEEVDAPLSISPTTLSDIVARDREFISAYREYAENNDVEERKWTSSQIALMGSIANNPSTMRMTLSAYARNGNIPRSDPVSVYMKAIAAASNPRLIPIPRHVAIPELGNAPHMNTEQLNDILRQYEVLIEQHERAAGVASAGQSVNKNVKGINEPNAPEGVFEPIAAGVASRLPKSAPDVPSGAPDEPFVVDVPAQPIQEPPGIAIEEPINIDVPPNRGFIEFPEGLEAPEQIGMEGGQVVEQIAGDIGNVWDWDNAANAARRWHGGYPGANPGIEFVPGGDGGVPGEFPVGIPGAPPPPPPGGGGGLAEILGGFGEPVPGISMFDIAYNLAVVTAAAVTAGYETYNNKYDMYTLDHRLDRADRNGQTWLMINQKYKLGSMTRQGGEYTESEKIWWDERVMEKGRAVPLTEDDIGELMMDTLRTAAGDYRSVADYIESELRSWGRSYAKDYHSPGSFSWRGDKVYEQGNLLLMGVNDVRKWARIHDQAFSVELEDMITIQDPAIISGLIKSSYKVAAEVNQRMLYEEEYAKNALYKTGKGKTKSELHKSFVKWMDPGTREYRDPSTKRKFEIQYDGAQAILAAGGVDPSSAEWTHKWNNADALHNQRKKQVSNYLQSGIEANNQNRLDYHKKYETLGRTHRLADIFYTSSLIIAPLVTRQFAEKVVIASGIELPPGTVSVALGVLGSSSLQRTVSDTVKALLPEKKMNVREISTDIATIDRPAVIRDARVSGYGVVPMRAVGQSTRVTQRELKENNEGHHPEPPAGGWYDTFMWATGSTPADESIQTPAPQPRDNYNSETHKQHGTPMGNKHTLPDDEPTPKARKSMASAAHVNHNPEQPHATAEHSGDVNYEKVGGTDYYRSIARMQPGAMRSAQQGAKTGRSFVAFAALADINAETDNMISDLLAN